jgi:hypothetical protein
MCTSGGWCWLNPLPQGNSLFDALVHDGEFWATGDDGLVLRGDGKHWLRCPTPTTESLRGSWFAPDGTLWVVGTGGVVLSFDGRAWTQRYSEVSLFLNDVHGTSGSDVWVVGDEVALHFDGTHWERHTLESRGTAYCVWAHAANDVWVGGSKVWHFDGTEWRAIYDPDTDARGIWGDELGMVWLAATHLLTCDRLGCQVTPTRAGAQFDVWGKSSTEVWTIGSEGGMRWDGSQWSTFEVPASMTAAAGGPPFGLVAVGHFGRMFSRKQDQWNDLRVAIGSVWTDVWGTADDDVWISGNSMVHYDGHGLVVTAIPTVWGPQVVHGTSAQDVWAAGCNGTLIHWNGQEWADHSVQSTADSPMCFRSLWADSVASIWAAGSAGFVYRWNGRTWEQLAPVSAASTSIAVYAFDGRAFAADDGGTLSAWQEQTWQPLATFASTQTHAMWGTSNNDLWLVGEDSGHGFLAHWTGSSLTQERVNATTLTDVWGTSVQDVWATGDGRVYHHDGQVLVEQPSGVSLSRSSIWASPTGVLWMAGGNGILRRAP